MVALTTGDDVFVGGAGAGNDTVFGGQGNDSIWGSTDDDLLLGNLGNDTISGSAGGDSVSFPNVTLTSADLTFI